MNIGFIIVLIAIVAIAIVMAVLAMCKSSTRADEIEREAFIKKISQRGPK